MFVKSLVLHGGMDAVLRACALPHVGFKAWQDVRECQCVLEFVGWNQLYELALEAYLALNVLYCFPELHSQSHGPELLKSDHNAPASQKRRDDKQEARLDY
jgi:hypothetical protein